MKNLSRTCVVSFLLWFVSFASGQHARLASGLNLRLRTIRVTQVDSTGVHLEAQATVTPGASVRVEAVRFRGIQVDGIPFAVAALPSFELRQGQESALPPLHMTASPSGPGALAVLLSLQHTRTLAVEGEADMVVRPGWLQRLVLRASNVRVVAVLNKNVPLHLSTPETPAPGLPSGFDSLLTLAKGFLRHVASPQESPAALPALPDALLHVRSCVVPAGCTELLGFRLLDRNGNSRTLTTVEAGDPWAFSATMRTALVRRPTEPVQVQVSGLAAAGRPSAAQHLPWNTTSVRSTREAPGFRAMLLPGRQEQAFRSRSAPGCFGVLDGAAAGAALPLAPAEARKQPAWSRLLVFRLVQTERDHWVWKPSWVTGTQHNGTIELSGTPGSATPGSPVLFEGNVVGMVQDETLAATL